MNGAARAAARLARADPAVAGLGTLLDPHLLSEALGAEVRLTRLRYKAGTSIVAAVQSDEGPRWVAAYDGPDKAGKALRHGGGVRPVDSIAHAVTGPALSDRALARAVRSVESRSAGLARRAAVLRYNPHRRLVLDAGAHGIVKLTHHPVDRVLALHRHLFDRGVAVLEPRGLGSRAWSAPRWGIGDLSEVPSTDSAERAGAVLASLHGVGAAPGLVMADAAAEAAAAAAAVGGVLPELAERASALVACAPVTGRATVVHGDFSADQVLVGDGVRVIDLDRCGGGDPMRDLASFAADELLRTGRRVLSDALVAGYRGAQGVVDGDALRRWLPVCVLLRAIEPFRRGDPEWPARVHAAVALAEETAP